MAKILVTGARGVVGGLLVKRLQHMGHNVAGLGRTHHHATWYARCDIGDYRQLARCIQVFSPEYVYHCAAEFGRWNGEDFYEQLWQSNCIGTKNIIRLQEDNNFRLIHFSSSEVYGDYAGVMSEDVMEKHEIKQLNDYAMTKWVNEMQILNSAKAYNTESVRVRLFNTYGPGERYSPYRSVNCRFCYSALHGMPITVYKGHHRTSTYLSDTVDTLTNIVKNFKPGEVYNIGGNQYHTIEELADIIWECTGASRDLITYADPEPMTTLDKTVDVTKSIHDLDHKNTITLEAGVASTIEWMKKEYGVK